jgi:predicted transport protein
LSELQANSNVIHQLLNTIRVNSDEMKVTQDEWMANQLELNSELSLFDTTGYLSASYSNEQTPPRSPFSPASSVQKQLEGGISKLWGSGIQSELTYSLSDSLTTFPSRSDFAFRSPVLQLTASSSLIQNFFYKRYDHMFKRIAKQKKSLTLQSKVDKKAVLVKALTEFSALLEQKEFLRLQQQVCSNTKVQSKNLARKRKRGTVSKSDYYLNLKELAKCEASIELAQSTLIAQEENFKANYNVDFNNYRAIKTNALFSEAKQIYQSHKEKKGQVDVKLQDDIRNLQLQVNSLEHKQGELLAQAQTNLELELRSGLTGLDNSVSASHNDLTQAEYPFVYVGLKLDLPLKNKQALQSAGANSYYLSALKRQMALGVKQKTSRLTILEKRLAKDFEVYRQYKKAVKLSQLVVKESRRDFDNGRLGLNVLTDFNNSLINDQRTLSSHRIQLIVRVVEYLDFFQYFDRYL